MEPSLVSAILEARSRRLTPNEIARKLGLKVADVKTVLKQEAIANPKPARLPPVVQCCVNWDAAADLLGPRSSDRDKNENLGPGLAKVVVARSERDDRFEACAYLVDYWCLGVKDAIEPRTLSTSEYAYMLDKLYEAEVQGIADGEPLPEAWVDISLAQAQAIVFKAVEYAAKLGFQPHPDFEKAKPFLGEWDGELQLTFGRNGQPFYRSGPYDNYQAILATLDRTVGKDNFDYIIAF